MRLAILGQYPLNPEKIRGGVETCIIQLVDELKKYKDIELHILTTEIMWRDITKKVDNVTVHYLASPLLPRFVTINTIDKFKIIRKLNELRPDIVHGHMSNYGYYALKSKYPSIVTIHGIAEEEYNRKIRSGLLDWVRRKVILQMEDYVFKNANILTVVSPYVKKRIESICVGEIYVIPNGVEKEFFNIEPNEIENRLLFVGGIEPRKGLMNLFKGVNFVREKNPNIRLHIVGRVRKKGYYNSLIDYIEKNNLQQEIIFKGELTNDEIKKEYANCSVFVFPSKEESFGIVLVEAEACGKPIIASNIGGIPYVVNNYETGLLVEFGDVDELAEKIQILLKDKKLRNCMGNAGKKKAKEFSNEDIAKKYYTLYKNILRI